MSERAKVYVPTVLDSGEWWVHAGTIWSTERGDAILFDGTSRSMLLVDKNEHFNTSAEAHDEVRRQLAAIAAKYIKKALEVPRA